MNNLILVCTIVLLACLLFKVPVYIALLAGSAVYFIANPTVNPIIFAQQTILGTEKITLLAIPFFICSGTLMNSTGITKRIMDFCSVLTGRLPGGLAQVNVLLSTLMGGLSGSNLADAAMEAKMLVPEMERKGFSRPFSAVVTAASSLITPLIPPGIGMIVYGVCTNVSIGKLFVSGISVGILLCASEMIMVHVISKKRNYVPLRTEKLSNKEFMAAFKPALLPLLLPVVIIGGIRLGIFTATEAGAVSIIYALVLGFMYREVRGREVANVLKETATNTASIMLIVAAASAFSWVLTRERVPQNITEWMVTHIHSKYIFLLAVNIFLIIVGMFIEGNASMIVLAPLLHPIAVAYGINEIQFAMVFIFNSAVGCLTPPLGTVMFVTCGITKCPLKDFIKECMPFFCMFLVDMILLTYVPFISTWLVNLIY